MQSPRPSAATIVLDERLDFLVMKRAANAATGAGSWSVPGGKLDPGETLESCAARELLEETGIVAEEMFRLTTITEDLAWGPELHFISHYYVVTRWSGQPRIVEPTKHSGLMWIDEPMLAAKIRAPTPIFPIFEPLAALHAAGGFREVAQHAARMTAPR